MRPFKRILVTGGAGYTGSPLVAELLARGYEVSVLDLLPWGRQALSLHPALRIFKGDIRDQGLLWTVLESQEAIIHLSRLSHDQGVSVDPETSWKANVTAFEALVRLSLQAKIRRLIYPSSCSLYGNASGRTVNEASPTVPLSVYAEEKLACEQIALREIPKGLPLVIVRPATVAGVSLQQRFDLLVNRMVGEAFFLKKIEAPGSHQIRPVIPIQDLVSLYCQLLEAPEELVRGETFNAAFCNQTVLETARTVAEIMGSSEIQARESDDGRNYSVSSQRLVSRLGFQPMQDLPSVVRELQRHLTAGKWLDAAVNPLYYNGNRPLSAKIGPSKPSGRQG